MSELIQSNEIEKNSKSKVAVASVLAGCLCMGTLAGTLAYFTDTDQKTNDFTIDEGLENKVNLEEPSWCVTFAENMVPTQTVAKDPQVHNESDMPVWVYAKVTVPMTDVQTAAADGTPNTDAGTLKPLFLLGTGTVTDVTPAVDCGVDHNGDAEGLGTQHTKKAVTGFAKETWGTDWTLDATKTVQDDAAKTITYTFKYAKQVAAGETTPKIFNAVQMANLVEVGDGTSSVAGAQEIVVDSYAIQTEGFANIDEAYAAYNAQHA